MPTATDAPELVDLAASIDQLFAWVRRHTETTRWSMTARTTLARLEREGPARVSDLARREGVTQPAMTGLVNRLEGEGLVERAADAADARASLVGVTAAGRAFIDARRAERVRVLAEQVATLPPADRRALLAAVPALRQLSGMTD